MRPGERLAAWRNKKGWTQTEAAKRLQVTQSAWSEWERGRKQPSLDLAFEIERFTSGAVKARMWAQPFVPTMGTMVRRAA